MRNLKTDPRMAVATVEPPLPEAASRSCSVFKLLENVLSRTKLSTIQFQGGQTIF
jgi:hypothetical protein